MFHSTVMSTLSAPARIPRWNNDQPLSKACAALSALLVFVPALRK